ncbi:MAG TPA: hypothetical protein VFZ65_15900 [Planctomycetota bacterium]|nr:hypothetical protein [Planctomycetota bacterium]
MHRSTKSCSPLRALLATVALALAACASTSNATSSSTDSAASATAKISQEVTATAQVIGLDPAARVVTLRSEDGRLRQVRAGEAVRNFDQIKVGDTLRVQYQAAMVATLLPAGEAQRPARGAVVAARAAKGAQPAAGVGVVVSVRVHIESIDAAHDLVVFKTASGELIAHRIASDEGRAFVRKLKVGDVVQLDYGEALALGIEKVAG